MKRFPIEVWLNGKLRYRAATRIKARRLALREWARDPLCTSYELVDVDLHPEGIRIETGRRRHAHRLHVKVA